MKPATERFSDRVEDYVKYRPGYPAEALDLLSRECGLTADATVADLGAGTGIFSQLLVQRGARVYAVEPNPDMRAAAERLLGGAPRFASIAASGEATGLPSNSVDLITVAQAFHWFDRDKARAEFSRILTPGGWVALIWNEREVDTTPFLQAYEQLLKDYAPEYGIVDHRNITPDDVTAFFRPGHVKLATFPYRQDFDFDGLQGRLLSSSYAPTEAHPNHAPMIRQLRAIFERYQNGGQVTWHYQTRVFYGQLD